MGASIRNFFSLDADRRVPYDVYSALSADQSLARGRFRFQEVAV